MYSIIEGPAKEMLKTSEVLDHIKTHFFEIDRLPFDFTSKQKDKYLML